MEGETITVQDMAVLAGEEHVGVMTVTPDAADQVTSALQDAGLATYPAMEHPAAPGVYSYDKGPGCRAPSDYLDDDCGPEDSRTCELGISLVKVMENAEAAGVPADRLEEIVTTPACGLDRDQAVLQAERRILALMPPGDDKTEAQQWCVVAFSDEACGESG